MFSHQPRSRSKTPSAAPVLQHAGLQVIIPLPPKNSQQRMKAFGYKSNPDPFGPERDIQQVGQSPTTTPNQPTATASAPHARPNPSPSAQTPRHNPATGKSTFTDPRLEHRRSTTGNNTTIGASQRARGDAERNKGGAAAAIPKIGPRPAEGIVACSSKSAFLATSSPPSAINTPRNAPSQPRPHPSSPETARARSRSRACFEEEEEEADMRPPTSNSNVGHIQTSGPFDKSLGVGRKRNESGDPKQGGPKRARINIPMTANILDEATHGARGPSTSATPPNADNITTPVDKRNKLIQKFYGERMPEVDKMMRETKQEIATFAYQLKMVLAGQSRHQPK